MINVGKEDPWLSSLEEDPYFTGLQVRDALDVVAREVTRSINSSLTLQQESPIIKAISDGRLSKNDAKISLKFFRKLETRLETFPEKKARDGYIAFWQMVTEACGLHKIQCAKGQDGLIPNSQADIAEKTLNLDSPATQRKRKELAGMIDQNHYQELGDNIRETLETDKLKNHHLLAKAGIYLAYGDYLILLNRLQQKQKSRS